MPLQQRGHRYDVQREDTGEREYQERLAKGGSAHSGSPVVADGKMYFAGEDRDVYVIEAGPKFERLATNPMGEVLMSTPAVAPRMLVIRGLKHVYGIAEVMAK